jgi:hypothetical protein
MKVDETTFKIRKTCDSIKEFLVAKNKSYGDSATKPLNIFSKGNAVQSLCARIDDKLARIKNRGIDKNTLDTVDDLIGYFVLLKIAIKDSKSVDEEENK